ECDHQPVRPPHHLDPGDQQQGERDMLREIGVRPDRLAHRRQAAIAALDLEADAADDDVERKRGGEQAEDRGKDRGDEGRAGDHGASPPTMMAAGRRRRAVPYSLGWGGRIDRSGEIFCNAISRRRSSSTTSAMNRPAKTTSLRKCPPWPM